jgi:anthranilate/para-aminobenzoate synthase component I
VDRQADAAAAGGDPQAQQALETINEAAGEVHAAAGSMDDATYLLDEAVGQYAEESCPDLEPVLEEQLEAMAHLENAIRLLQPPRQQQQDRQQQQQRQQPQPQEDEMSRRQAERRLQAIREREAERQRDRSEAQQPEPVEKDW